MERHGLGRAPDGKVGEQFVLVATLGGDLGGLQVQRRKVLLVEEVRALEVTVTHLVGGSDAAGLNLGDDRGGLNGVTNGDCATEFSEVTANLRRDEVAGNEADG